MTEQDAFPVAPGTASHGSPTSPPPSTPSAGSAAAPSAAPSGLVLPRGVAQVRPDAPAAVLMVRLDDRQVVFANPVAAQMAPDLALPVAAEAWSAAADLRDLDGAPLDETSHPLSRVARFEPVAGAGVSAGRASDLGARREPLWVVALPLEAAPDLAGYALVVFLPVRDREALQQRAATAHADAAGAPGTGSATGAAAGEQPGDLTEQDVAAVREAAVLATGLSFTVADARAADMPLVWVNPAFTAVTGYGFASAVGRNCRFLQGPGTDPATTAAIRAALEAGESVTVTLLNYRADGTAFWNQLAMSPVLDASGTVTHYVGIQTDVSGRVAADAERDRALAAERDARGRAEVAQERLLLLGEVTRQLSDTHDAAEALQRLARLVVPQLGDFAVLALAADDGTTPTQSSASSATASGDAVGAAASSGALSGASGAGGEQAAGRSWRPWLRDVAWWHVEEGLRPLVEQLAAHRLEELSERGRAQLAQLLASPDPLVRPDPQRASASDANTDEAGGAARWPTAHGSPQPSAEPSAQSLAEPSAADLAAASLDPGAARRALQQLAPSSVATFVLRGRDRPLGLLTVATGGGRAPISAEQVLLGTDIAARAGLALDAARLYRQQRDLAEGLQRSLLELTPTPQPDHLQIAVRYVAAAEAAQVGGDFYDAFTQPAGATVVVIGDVVGHDTQAAAAMAQLRSVVRGFGVVADDAPAVLLARTDQVMARLGTSTLATALAARLQQPEQGSTRAEDGDPGASGGAGEGVKDESVSGGDAGGGGGGGSADEAVEGAEGTEVVWSSAGHPPAMVITPDGRVHPLERRGQDGQVLYDLLLGVDAATTRHDSAVRLARGSTLVLYSDGLVERRDQPLAEGLQRLQVVLGQVAARGGDLESLVDAVLEQMLPARPSDDVAVLAARLHREDRPRPDGR